MKCNLELKNFFNELKEYHQKIHQDFVWNWEQVDSPKDKDSGVRDFVYYIAFNLSKNILHGPLPNHLHSRMIFNQNKWSKKYFDYLEGKIKYE